jgi:hypothetical protein
MALQPAANQALALPGFNLVAIPLAGGRIRVTLPTASPANRAFMASICINVSLLSLSSFCVRTLTQLKQPEELQVAQMPSHDVDVILPAGTDLRLWVAKLIRREGYFRALLVQSRGVLQGTPCARRCGGNTGPSPFTDCRTVAGFQGDACGSCVWQSRGAQCNHHV